MNNLVINVASSSLDNNNFRKVLLTTNHMQLVLMSLKVGEDIGEEIHQLDQFIYCQAGEGSAVLNGKKHIFNAGFSVLIPAGTKHNILNVSDTAPLKLYTVYAPPNHRDGTIHTTKAEAAADEEHFDGLTTSL